MNCHVSDRASFQSGWSVRLSANFTGHSNPLVRALASSGRLGRFTKNDAPLPLRREPGGLHHRFCLVRDVEILLELLKSASSSSSWRCPFLCLSFAAIIFAKLESSAPSRQDAASAFLHPLGGGLSYTRCVCRPVVSCELVVWYQLQPFCVHK
jgi:hypothetical protein